MKEKWLKLLLVWQIVGILVTLIITVSLGNFHHYTHDLMMTLSFTNSIALAGSGLYLIERKWIHVLVTNRYIRYAILLVAAGVILGTSSVFALRIGGIVCGFDNFVVDQWHFLTIAVNLVVMATVTVAVILYFLHQRAMERLTVNIRENEQLKQLQLESKLSLLQSKINPHFLFNTLNTMLDIVKHDSNEVEHIILNLSDIYRRTLTSPDKALIPVSEELDLVEKYLEIEKIRMGDRLSYHIDTPDGVGSVQIPPMIIQILVENAVKHGLSPKQNGGTITIRTSMKDTRLVIEVTDDGVGIDTGKESSGFGLYSIQQRIKLHYYDQGTMSIRTPDAGGTTVIIELPQ